MNGVLKHAFAVTSKLFFYIKQKVLSNCGYIWWVIGSGDIGGGGGSVLQKRFISASYLNEYINN